VLIISLSVAIVLVKFKKIGASAIGAWGGFVFGIFLNETWFQIY